MRFSASSAVLLGLLACAGPGTAGPAGPNIVLIVSDDQGYGEMSCQGGDIPTPHLDALAARGVRFTAGYVTASYCSPSRAGFLTGRYQQRFGHEMNPVQATQDRPDVGLPVEQKTLADHLKAAGYATGMFGKWHLGDHPPFHPTRRGFDEFYGFMREGHYYLPPPYEGPADRVVVRFRPKEPEYDRRNPVLRGTTRVDTFEYLTNAFAKEAASFIGRNAGRPFFLYLPFNTPHSPMQTLPRDYARFPGIADHHRRVWAGMIASMDDAVGAVTAALRRHGLERNTLVVFLSDNGGPTKELTSRNDPFSGGKGSVREGGVRIPFIMSWPGRIPAGKVYDRPVISLDILPTALAAAGAPTPGDLDGVDLVPWLRGEREGDPHGALFWRMGDRIAVRRGNWKLIRERRGQPFRLYDLDADVKESNDLASAEPERVASLTKALAGWESRLIPPRFTNRR